MLSAEERFFQKVDKTEKCWYWIAHVDRCGYGQFWHDKQRSAHRVAYEMLIGPIPSGLTLDHLCRNRRCVNPDHLETVTHEENMRRSRGYHLKTHCPKGHPYDEVNSYHRKGERLGDRGRNCRACNAQAVARYKTRRSA